MCVNCKGKRANGKCCSKSTKSDEQILLSFRMNLIIWMNLIIFDLIVEWLYQKSNKVTVVSNHYKILHIQQSVQEWTIQNLWKTAFKKFEGVWSA